METEEEYDKRIEDAKFLFNGVMTTNDLILALSAVYCHVGDVADPMLNHILMAANDYSRDEMPFYGRDTLQEMLRIHLDKTF